MINFAAVATHELEQELLRRRVLSGSPIEIELRNRGTTDLLSISLKQGAVHFSSRTCTAQIAYGSEHFAMLKLMLERAEANAQTETIDANAKRG